MKTMCRLIGVASGFLPSMTFRKWHTRHVKCGLPSGGLGFVMFSPSHRRAVFQHVSGFIFWFRYLRCLGVRE